MITSIMSFDKVIINVVVSDNSSLNFIIGAK